MDREKRERVVIVLVIVAVIIGVVLVFGALLYTLLPGLLGSRQH